MVSNRGSQLRKVRKTGLEPPPWGRGSREKAGQLKSFSVCSYNTDRICMPHQLWRTPALRRLRRRITVTLRLSRLCSKFKGSLNKIARSGLKSSNKKKVKSKQKNMPVPQSAVSLRRQFMCSGFKSHLALY